MPDFQHTTQSTSSMSRYITARSASGATWFPRCRKACLRLDDSKKAYSYICKCGSCKKVSMHLSYEDIELYPFGSNVFRFSVEEGTELDDLFFYSVPTSVFAIDDRVPKEIRELLTEAEGSLKSNFLTGASACIRKIVYELARIEKAEGTNYDDRIKSLKKKRPDVTDTYFDTLLTIQQVTSEKVHENSYDGWTAEHIRLILRTLREILQEMYVLPAAKDDMRKQVLALRDEILGGQSEKSPKPANRRSRPTRTRRFRGNEFSRSCWPRTTTSETIAARIGEARNFLDGDKGKKRRRKRSRHSASTRASHPSRRSRSRKKVRPRSPEQVCDRVDNCLSGRRIAKTLLKKRFRASSKAQKPPRRYRSILERR